MRSIDNSDNSQMGEDILDADVGPEATPMVQEMHLAQALNLWVELTSVEPGHAGGYSLGDLDVYFLNREIQEALDLDPTELTGRMLLSYVAQDYFEQRQFNVDALLNRPQAVASYLAKAQHLSQFLRGPSVAGMGEQFAQRLKDALGGYGALTPEVAKIVDHQGNHGDRGLLAVLRRDAMRTLKNLSVHQFLDGEPEAPGARPAYGKFVYRWDNINSMLTAMCGAPSGITVNMVQSKNNEYGVHFVFAIRNGGRLFVFTDKEQVPHPLAQGLWRRPDKILANRANRNWFPYDLAGLKFTDEGRAYIETAHGRSLVTYQSRPMPIKPLAELSPPQVIWLAMMLDLIVEKFWHQDFHSKQLSYTAEMVRVATPLLEAAQAANLPVVTHGHAVLQLPPIRVADVHSDAINEEDVGTTDNRHRWLEDRYRDKVLEETVDIVDAGGEPLLLGSDGAIVAESQLATVPWFRRDDSEIEPVKLEALDPTSFGTAEDLQRDRKFLARSNYASQIALHAEREYRDRRKEIQAWVHEHMMGNMPRLQMLLTMPQLWVRTESKGQPFEDRCFGVRYEAGRRQFIVHHDLAAVKQHLYTLIANPGSIVAGGQPWKVGAPTCHFTGGPSVEFVQLVPETAEQLAWMCGVAPADLPDVLQHWGQWATASGNHILRRVDPMLWLVRDPWRQLCFRLSVFLSKRALARLQAQAKSVQPELAPFFVK